MSFVKYAHVQHLGSFTTDEEGHVRKAQLDAPETKAAQTSYYLDGEAKVDVGGVLKRVASDYAISADPSDYLFEVIRANTTSVFNDNHDGFARDELLRFDPKLKTAVFLTYREKPHHVNHRTDNPKRARGVILDAHYNCESTPLETCPGCNSKTASVDARDDSGIFCKKCGSVVNDEFVEILVAVDKKKDPMFARAVERGQLRFGSMGCTCAQTVCNVCQNTARTRGEFCSHIASHKGSYWAKKADDQDWTKVNLQTAQAEMAKRKRAFHTQDFVRMAADDGYEIRKAAEWCQGVIYDEYSRVHMPADPKAEQRELLKAAASTDNLSAETAQLIAAARINGKRRTKSAVQERSAMQYHVVRVDGDSDDAYAADSMEAAVELANPEPGSMLEHAIIEAASPLDAREQVTDADFQPLKDHHGDVVININDGPAGTEVGLDDESEEDPLDEGDESIEDFTDELLDPEVEAPEDAEFSPEELGVMPAGASKEASMTNYSNWKVRVTPRGNAQVLSPHGPALLIQPRTAAKTDAQRSAFGGEVMDHLAAHGLFATARHYDAALHAKFASVVDHALDDMKEFSDKGMKSDVASGGGHDMRSPPSAEDRGKHADDMTKDDHTDMQDARKKQPASVRDDRVLDHELSDSASPNSSSENEESDMRDKRREFNLASDSVLDDAVNDRKAQRIDDRDEAAGRIMQLREQMRSTNDMQMRHDLAGEIEMLKSRFPDLDESDEEEPQMGLADDEVGMREMTHRPGKGRDVYASRVGQWVRHAKTGKRAKVVAFDKAANKFTLADQKLDTTSVTTRDLSKQWHQLDKAPASYEDNLKRWAKAEIAKAEKTAQARVFRALRLAASRAHKGVERSPLKEAIATELANNRVVGHDGRTQAPLEYAGMSDELAVHLVEAAFKEASEADTDALLQRAASLLKHDANYLRSAEADLKKVAHRVPTVTAASMVNDLDREAETLRRQASAGNLELNATPSDAAQLAEGATDKIRNALGGTRVGTRIQLRR